MTNSCYLDYTAPWIQGRVKNALIVLGSSILMALSGQMILPLPFTPVPIVLQAHVVLLLAACLGSKRGVAAVSLLLLQGLVGLPVFSFGGSGIAKLLGPTGGYLWGYLLAAFITGWLAERTRAKSALSYFYAMGVGNLVIYACGVIWLSQFLGWMGAVVYGLLPFVVGDFLKLVIATKLLQRRRNSSAA